MIPTTQSKPIPFSQFGALFIERVLTPERIKSQIMELIGSDPIKFQDSLAEGTIVPEVGEVKRTIKACQVLVQVPLVLQLTFKIQLLGETYEGPATVPLNLVVRMYEPAILHFEAARIRAADIVFAGETVEGWGLAKRLGKRWKLLDKSVRGRIRDQINARLAITQRARMIDLAALTLETTAIPASEQEYAPSLRSQDAGPVVPTETVLRGTLEPHSGHFYSVALGEGEQCKFRIYTASDRYPIQIRSSFGIYWPSGEIVAGTRALISTEAGWFGEYSISEQVFRAPRIGIYRFGLRNEERRNDYMLRYIIHQDKSRPELGEPLCGDRLGPALVQNVVSPPIVERRLKQLIPAHRSFGPLSILSMVQADGDARIRVLAVERERPRPAMADRELAYKVLLRIDPDVCITLLGVQEHWRLQTLVTLRLRIHALANPLSIQIDPDQVTVQAIKVLDAICTEGAGAFNRLNLLSKSIAQPLVDQIKQMLSETEPERTIDIEEFVSRALQVRSPALPAPQRVIQDRTVSKTVEGVGRSGKIPSYWKVRLNEKQKAEFSAHWRFTSRPRRPINVSLAVCDEHRGLLQVENVVSGSTGKLGSGKLEFTAPREAAYFVRLRLDPWKGDEGLQAQYEIKLMVT